MGFVKAIADNIMLWYQKIDWHVGENPDLFYGMSLDERMERVREMWPELAYSDSLQNDGNDS